MKSKMRSISQKVTYWSGVVAIGLLVGLSLQFVRAWTEPSLPATGDNVAGPVNVSGVFQSKGGSLEVRGLGIVGGVIPTGAALVIPNGNVAVGNTIPNNSKTGIIDAKDFWVRDANGGAGAWASALGGINLNYIDPERTIFARSPLNHATQTLIGFTDASAGYSDVNSWVNVNLNNYSPPAGAKFAIIKFVAVAIQSRPTWIKWRPAGSGSNPTPVALAYSAHNTETSSADTNVIWVPFSSSSPSIQILWNLTGTTSTWSGVRAYLVGWVN